jgi:hypothetical protein
LRGATAICLSFARERGLTSAAAAIADQHGDKADSIKLVMSDPKKAQNVRAVYEMLVAVDAAKAAKPAADGS